MHPSLSVLVLHSCSLRTLSLPVLTRSLKETIIMRCLFFGVICIVFGIIACNPVKKVLNNPNHFEKVAKEVVRRGYCINDTITHDTLTTTIVKDSLIHDTLKVTPSSNFLSIDT